MTVGWIAFKFYKLGISDDLINFSEKFLKNKIADKRHFEKNGLPKRLWARYLMKRMMNRIPIRYCGSLGISDDLITFWKKNQDGWNKMEDISKKWPTKKRGGGSLGICDDHIIILEKSIRNKMADGGQFKIIATWKAFGRDILWTVCWITLKLYAVVSWVFLMIWSRKIESDWYSCLWSDELRGIIHIKTRWLTEDIMQKIATQKTYGRDIFKPLIGSHSNLMLWFSRHF